MSALKIFLLCIFLVSLSYSQSFDLLCAKPSDKIAQSKFFRLDSSKAVQEYEVSSFSVPVARIQDSLFVIAGIRSSVSGAKNSVGNSVKDFSLDQNYPNPFNPSTAIRFSVGKTAKVSIVLYDMTGKEVVTLINDVKEAGSYNVEWNGRTNNGTSAASGTYLYRMIAAADGGNTTVQTKKMILIK
jgi:hypothetical protein